MKVLFIFLVLFVSCISIVSAQQHATGVILDDSAYQVPEAPLQKSPYRYTFKPYVSFRKYTPVPQDQKECQSCVGWACAYAGMTTMWAQAMHIENKSVITQNAFNPDYLYFSLTKSCNTGADIFKAMDKMKNDGLLLNKYLSGPDTGKVEIQADKLTKIYFYDRIFEFNSDSAAVVKAVRTCLNDGTPVIIVDHIDHNLDSLYKKNFVWVPKTVPDENAYHAMCVIGYDDKQKRFEIMNSWGTDWGDNGYFYESYRDFGRTTHYAFQIYPNFDTSLQTNIIDVAGDIKIEKNISPHSNKYVEINLCLPVIIM
jgi:hypothetical protein